MDKIVLHTCCAPCATFVLEQLSQQFNVTALFYNPNIQPEEEYIQRLNSLQKLCGLRNIELVELEYDTQSWLSLIHGLENEPEGSKRCDVCFRYRLARTAEFAAQNKCSIIASTLTISPHKDAQSINTIGAEVAARAGIEFLDRDFKKNGGFTKSCEMSRHYGLYRQTYCGCTFSIKR